MLKREGAYVTALLQEVNPLKPKKGKYRLSDFGCAVKIMLPNRSRKKSRAWTQSGEPPQWKVRLRPKFGRSQAFRMRR
jgi:hypothetical protein